MDSDVKCPECGSAYAYQDGSLWVCPECAHEWGAAGAAAEAAPERGCAMPTAIRWPTATRSP